jgi:hypothetical protein
MAVNPDNLDELKNSVADAIKKERNRPRSRTPNAAENNNGKYPLRSVQEYIGGHRTIFDNTPGARIVETAHGAGTFQQWSEDGSEIKVVVGNAHQHIKEGYTLTVNQNGDIKIDGHCRVSVGGGVHVEVRGDVSLVSTGKITAFTAKDYNIVAGGKVNILGRGGVNISTDSSFKVKAAADQSYKIGGNSFEEIKGNSDTKISGNADSSIDGDLKEKIGGSASENVSGDKTSTSSTFKVTSGRIDLN